MAAKFTHIVASRRPGSFVAFALCGRRVDFMSTGIEAEATCTKCLAESLAVSTQKAEA